MLVVVLTLLAASPVKVAAMGLRGVNVDAAEATFMSDYLAHQLRSPGLEVVTQTEVAGLIGLERQRQLAGCSEVSCLAELAGALGVDAIISGSAARLGSAYAMTVSLVRTGDGKILGSWSEKLGSSEQALDWLKEIAPDMRKAAVGPTPAEVVAPESSASSSRLPRILPWVSVGAGAVALAAGVGLQVSARGLQAAISSRRPDITVANLDNVIASGQAQEIAANVLLGVGLALVVVGIVWWLL